MLANQFQLFTHKGPSRAVMGGNSLLVMRAVVEAERMFGLKVDPRRYVNESLLQLSATTTANPGAAAAAQAFAADLCRCGRGY